MARVILALCLLFLGKAVTAQTWEPRVFDNGSWFTISTYNPQGVGFYCGGRSAGGIPLPQTDAPLMTPDYTIMMTMALAGLGTPQGQNPPRNDIMLVSGTTGYILPATQYDELDGSGWTQLLDVGDPLFERLLSGGGFEVRVGQTPVAMISGTGLSQALEVLIAGCDQRWALINTPVPAQAVDMVKRFRAGAAPSAAAPALNSVTMSRARNRARDICDGGVQENEPAFLSAEIDGDGIPDTVVKWDAITCLGPFPRPLCGASHCSVQVHLSSRDRAFDLLSQSTGLVPLSNGLTGLSVVGRFDSCGPDNLGCKTIWHWNGADLVQLQ